MFTLPVPYFIFIAVANVETFVYKIAVETTKQCPAAISPPGITVLKIVVSEPFVMLMLPVCFCQSPKGPWTATGLPAADVPRKFADIGIAGSGASTNASTTGGPLECARKT